MTAEPKLDIKQMEFISFINENKLSAWKVSHFFIEGTLFINISLQHFGYADSFFARITHDKENHCMTISFGPGVMYSHISFALEMLRKQKEFRIFHIQQN